MTKYLSWTEIVKYQLWNWTHEMWGTDCILTAKRLLYKLARQISDKSENEMVDKSCHDMQI